MGKSHKLEQKNKRTNLGVHEDEAGVNAGLILQAGNDTEKYSGLPITRTSDVGTSPKESEEDVPHTCESAHAA